MPLMVYVGESLRTFSYPKYRIVVVVVSGCVAERTKAWTIVCRWFTTLWFRTRLSSIAQMGALNRTRTKKTGPALKSESLL